VDEACAGCGGGGGTVGWLDCGAPGILPWKYSCAAIPPSLLFHSDPVLLWVEGEGLDDSA
jgi:hypothetical protein